LNRRKCRREAAARESFVRARDALAPLVEKAPGDARLVNDLSWTVGNVAALECALGRSDAGLALHVEVLALRDRLLRADPASVVLRLDRAWCLIDIGAVQRRVGRHGNSAETLAEARDVL